MADAPKGRSEMLGTWQRGLDTQTRQTSVVSWGEPGSSPLIPGLTILWHADPQRIGERVALPELPSGQPVAISRLQPMFAAPGTGVARPLADSHLSRTPVFLRTLESGRIQVERGEHRGRVTLDGQALEQHSVVDLSADNAGTLLVLSSYAMLFLHLQDPAPTPPEKRDSLVGDSTAMQRLRQEISRVRRLTVPVLLRGESGTGKELVAQEIHRQSPRSSRPCLSVNMAAIPSSLAASELFGSTKGAFSGADRNRLGFFQRADQGTLFLDEVGETPQDVQALLLRALETGEVQSVGADKSRQVDVRVISATDADLDSAVAEGGFRLPLVHRLAGYEIHLPPLRRRRDDIPRLLMHFLRQELAALGADNSAVKALPLHLMAALVNYHWPGNVRQLRNVARRLAILFPEPEADLWAQVHEVIGESLLAIGSSPNPDSGTATPVPEATTAKAPRKKYRKPSDVSEEELLAALEQHAWRLKPTAEALGVSRASLYLLIEACQSLRKARELERDEIDRALASHHGDVTATAQFLKVSEQGLKRRITELVAE